LTAKKAFGKREVPEEYCGYEAAGMVPKKDRKIPDDTVERACCAHVG